MIDKLERERCTGCKACGSICPTEAISFDRDIAGFGYPRIDPVKCIQCDACESVCTVMHPYEDTKNPPKVYSATNKDEGVRYRSTSGGVYAELTGTVISQGGCAAGAVYSSEFQVFHQMAGTREEAERQMRSKYVQSDMGNIYREVDIKLRSGRKVIFSGLPCQAEAMKRYISQKSPGYKENLILVDLICCGACSPEVFKSYLDWLRKKYHSQIESVWFKNKKYGWHSIATEVKFKNGREYCAACIEDPYMISYINDGLSLRECCYHCEFKKMHHESDITLGDFWGIEKIEPCLDDNKGISALLIHSGKGKDFIDNLENKFNMHEFHINTVLNGNYTYLESHKKSENRDDFLRDLLMRKKSFLQSVIKYGSFTRLRVLKSKLRAVKRRITVRRGDTDE